MSPLADCIICREIIVNQLKIGGNCDKNNGRALSEWEVLCVESLCMLFGLPVNHRFTSGGLAGREIGQFLGQCKRFCNECLEKVSSVQCIFWQIHSLETRLVQLQNLLFQRLQRNYDHIDGVGLDGNDTQGALDNDVIGKSLFEEIRNWKESWPARTYSGRWEDARKYAKKYVRNQIRKEGESLCKGNNWDVDPDLAIKEEIEDFDGLPVMENKDDEKGYQDDERDQDFDLEEFDFDVDRDTSSDSSDWDYEDEPKRTKTQPARKPRRQKSVTAKKRKKTTLSGEKSKDKVLLIHLCTFDPDICSRTYSRKKDLSQHIKDFHKGRTHVCDYDGCVEKFLSEKVLTWHKYRVHGLEREKKYRCNEDPVCNRSYSTKIDLTAHIKEFHGGRRHKCKYEGCSETFLKESTLLEHKVKVHGAEKTPPRSRVCEICGITVISKRWSEHYRKRHLGQEKISCERCSMNFNTSQQLESHEQLHDQVSPTLPFTCVLPECQKVFSNSLDLKSHVVNNHLTGWLKCDVCGVLKPNRKVLEKHKIIHEKNRERNFICDECPSAFFSESHLRSHKKDYHTGNKYTCETCGKEFNLRHSYVRHMLGHQQYRPFKCSICSKAFRAQQQLKRHEAIHSGIKNHTCELCGKSFKQEQNLKQHLNTQQHKGQMQPKVVKPASEIEGLKLEEVWS